MRSSSVLRSLARIVFASCVFLVIGVAQASPAPDAWITTRAKLALFTANVANATMVHVDTIDGRVMLYGKVSSAAQKKKADGVVRGISGVTSVGNMLEVINPADVKVVDASDDRIKVDVQKRLDADKSLADDHVAVKSVNNGSVLLSGQTVSLSDHLQAVECAYEVPGVRSVTTEITSPKEVATYEMTPKQGGVKEAARDDWLIAGTKIRFLADSDVPALQVGVDACHNVVTLFGIVPSEGSKSAAEADVLKVDGTVSVKNELQVVPASSRRLVDAKDDRVKHSVEKALRSRKEFKGVSVDVKNGVVRLTGTVASDWQRLKAGMITRGATGVRSVDDDLKV